MCDGKPKRYFNPLPPCGGRLCYHPSKCYHTHFNPLPPCGGRHVIAPNSHLVQYFNPLPPCGGRPVSRYTPARARIYFNPLPPCGGRRFWFRFGVYSEQFQSTPSVWRETAPVIHVTCQCRDFNPRPPCGGRRHGSQGRDGRLYTFQSTPSVWRETGHGQQDCRPYPISIHSLRVEGDRRILTMQEEGAISIHSLRVEGDSSWYNIISTRHRFQSTPSVWRETTLYRIYSTQEDISIHSLRVEGDTLQRIADTLNAISIHSLRVEGDR